MYGQLSGANLLTLPAGTLFPISVEIGADRLCEDPPVDLSSYDAANPDAMLD